MQAFLTLLPDKGPAKPGHRDIREDIFRQHLDRSIAAVVIPEAAGVLSGLESARDLAETLEVAFETEARDGQEVVANTELARVTGNPVQVSKAEELLVGALSKASGIASAARMAKMKVGSRCRLVSGGIKKIPHQMKSIVRKAVMDGGLEVRMLDQPFLYIDKNYVRIFGGITAAMEAVAPLERPTVIQIRGEFQPIDEEAIAAARGGATVIMVDTGEREHIGMVARALRRDGLRSSVQVAFSGNITIDDLGELCLEDVDALDVGYAILDAPCLPMRFDVVT
jgi:nicotinate-nucleotide pyrophosphorylase (carboxylating)